MPFQRDLANESEMHQSRISMFETPGAANITLETISKIAAGLRAGVIIKFVPFSEMLAWENAFAPDTFDVTRLDQDDDFLNPATARSTGANMIAGLPRPVSSTAGYETALGIENAAQYGSNDQQLSFSTAAGG
jgi:hypothetical protein